MNSPCKSLAAGLVLLALNVTAGAVSPGQAVANFKAKDQTGKVHELYQLANARAVVVMIQGNGCPIVRQALPALQEIRKRYQARGVEFLLLNSNQQDDSAAVAQEAREFGIELPILVDTSQVVGEALGVQRTSEVFVIEPKTWTLAYRGPMDDRLSYERQRPAASRHYLTDALDELLAGKAVTVTHADGVGCLVNFPDRGKKKSRA